MRNSRKVAMSIIACIVFILCIVLPIKMERERRLARITVPVETAAPTPTPIKEAVNIKEMLQTDSLPDFLNKPEPVIEEEYCNPTLSVTNEYRFKPSIIGFTAILANDCNYIFPAGYAKIQLRNSQGRVYREKVIEHIELKPYTSTVIDFIFKNEKYNPYSITYGLKRK